MIYKYLKIFESIFKSKVIIKMSETTNFENPQKRDLEDSSDTFKKQSIQLAKLEGRKRRDLTITIVSIICCFWPCWGIYICCKKDEFDD
jgi:hypothetical protein